MKKLDEIREYLSNKREIYMQIIDAIDKAVEADANRILLSNLKLMDTQVDAFANRKEWPDCLEKARAFFEGMEDYESCQRCMDLLSKVSKK